MKRAKNNVVGVDERGQRVGESHQRAKLSDHDVDLIRELYEDHGLTLVELAEKFDVHKSCVHKIVTYRTRCHTVVEWKPG